MKKEEILEASKKENKNQDLFELEVFHNAQRAGGLAAIILAVFLSLIEFEYVRNPGYTAILQIALFVSEFYQFIRIRNKRNLIYAIGWAFVFFLTMYKYYQYYQTLTLGA